MLDQCLWTSCRERWWGQLTFVFGWLVGEPSENRTVLAAIDPSVSDPCAHRHDSGALRVYSQRLGPSWLFSWLEAQAEELACLLRGGSCPPPRIRSSCPSTEAEGGAHSGQSFLVSLGLCPHTVLPPDKAQTSGR